MHRVAACAILALLLGGCSTSPAPQAGPADVAITLVKVVDGLERPVFATPHPSGGGRLAIAEQGGRVLLWDGRAKTTVLDLSDRVSTAGLEQGLLGLAYLPDGLGFAVHTTDPSGDIDVGLYREACSAAGCTATRQATLLTAEHSAHGNHNGGMLAFGPDGLLYVGLGDGGGRGDPGNNAQDLFSPLGKILRIGVAPGGAGATVPADNPFVGESGDGRVWAYGLRNPWRFSFDRATGDLWIGDVGQDDWEEVDVWRAGSAAGVNYGWSRFEGSHRHSDREAPGAVAPVWEYGHGGGQCSITGGHVYRGSAVPALQGSYVYGDFCTGEVWGLREAGGGWQNRLLLDTPHRISSFGEDAQGELLVIDHGGAIYRVVAG